MHPPLTLHRHPMCAEVIEQFQKCHLDHPIGKFFGQCTDLKIKLDRCFRQEKSVKRKANFEESKKFKERLRACKKEIDERELKGRAMGIVAAAGAKVSEYKKGILVFFVTSTVLSFAITNVAPRFADMFAYFWPLFVSTTVFMGAIIAFTQVPPLAVDYRDERDGEWLLEYLTGLPQQS